MPRLWSETIETHRREVRDAVLDATAALVAERGLLAVTMSEVAGRAQIGRATLYKYFPDVAAILAAWHERQVASHLEHLEAVRDGAADPVARLESVLAGYAHICRMARRHQGSDLAAALHEGGQIAEARQRLLGLVRDLLVDARDAAVVRDDVVPEELASYCLHALAAAGEVDGDEAVDRLVAITLAGLRPVTA
ncbi:TetR/AcrR family transcriptional regulator [Saccharothrix sp. AJ9571]|nr:TetR/AcrR family transcriptional regulator [Saccharothrix sp. AJ9571]